MKAAIYARVSTEGRGQDTENQLIQLKEFASAMKWTLAPAHIYTDNASASGKVKRPAFVKLFEDASKRRFDIVLFWSLDRFSREGVLGTLNHLKSLDSYGIGWRSYTEQYLDSTGIFKDAVISILATVAKQERIRISERTKAGLDRVRLAGQQLGRKPRCFNVAEAGLMISAGKSYRQVAAAFGVSVSILHRAVKAQAGLQITSSAVSQVR